MLLVDDRIGSADLCQPLQQMGLPAELVRLDFGDCCFEGRGDDDTTVDIGVELKKLPDLIQSLRDGRLQGHQLAGMAKLYAHSWLVIEGQWTTNKAGLVSVYKDKGRGWVALPGKMSASELEKKVLTLELLGGVHVRFTPDRRATLHFLASLFYWWRDKSLDRHTTHLAQHVTHGFIPISDFRRTVQSFPGIGLRTSKAVETAFSGSLVAAVTASVEQWARIVTTSKGGRVKRIGTATAERIVKFCRGTA